MFPTDISGRRAVGFLMAHRPELSNRIDPIGLGARNRDCAQGEADAGVAKLTAAEANNDLQVEPLRNSVLQFFARRSAGSPSARS